jgi:hypothetical protein
MSLNAVEIRVSGGAAKYWLHFLKVRTAASVLVLNSQNCHNMPCKCSQRNFEPFLSIRQCLSVSLTTEENLP